MNLKSPLRRTAVLAAGALIGLSGAFALAGPASAHHNIVSGQATCDKVAGEWVVDWSVQAVGNAPTYKWTEVSLTPAGTTIDNEAFKVDGKTELENNKVVTGKQRVPGTETSSTLTVAAHWTSGDAKATGTATFEGKCEKETPPTTPTPTPTATTPPVTPPDLPGEPAPIFEETCDTITIGLDNPADGVEITLGYKTSKGEQRTLVIKPGEKKSETFSAKPGFSIDLTFSATVDGKKYSETDTIKYEQPADCDSSGNGGGLPVTGAAAGGIAGGAAALLAVGAGLFFMARRRKVKFTA
ncbi:hypothetical protein GCM10020358_16350 [Amorphoplanes nipponensis]|uniref:LPXTG-motif cell wall anchor domain-containing protein n=1 Tax=Actinoplanes nipponensis TaxID=135950 RepID=A0A919MKJ6_9ACTN|nr:hypothetical protein [Actinoplanes nipponensis]GIE52939.1 hypothetical protein Ani05nite_64730 [Actinoplanes nipponensis]